MDIWEEGGNARGKANVGRKERHPAERHGGGHPLPN